MALYGSVYYYPWQSVLWESYSVSRIEARQHGRKFTQPSPNRQWGPMRSMTDPTYGKRAMSPSS
jgi:hypothetical protein